MPSRHDNRALLPILQVLFDGSIVDGVVELDATGSPSADVDRASVDQMTRKGHHMRGRLRFEIAGNQARETKIWNLHFRNYL